jgi:glycosyltransferase involved in cell wall biosynthesis
LLEAMAEVLKQFPNTALVIAGDGPLRAFLEDKARAMDIEASVHFAGNRGDVPCLLSIADCFVLSSLWEGLPIALLEAMRAGLPIIATNVDGTREVIENGVNGLLVPAADVKNLAHSIIRLMSDDVLRQRIGMEGRAEVLREYGYDRMCEEYRALFQRELEARG